MKQKNWLMMQKSTSETNQKSWRSWTTPNSSNTSKLSIPNPMSTLSLNMSMERNSLSMSGKEGLSMNSKAHSLSAISLKQSNSLTKWESSIEISNHRISWSYLNKWQRMNFLTVQVPISEKVKESKILK